MDVYYTYSGNCFTIYTYIKSCCIPENNTMLYINYIAISKKNRKKRTLQIKAYCQTYQLIFLDLKCIFK